jgi:hypothetical protein
MASQALEPNDLREHEPSLDLLHPLLLAPSRVLAPPSGLVEIDAPRELPRQGPIAHQLARLVLLLLLYRMYALLPHPGCTLILTIVLPCS